MTTKHSLDSASSPRNTIYASLEDRTVASYKRELARRRRTEIRLREALSRDEVLLRQKDTVIQQQDVLSKESDHRLLNGMQMIASLLSLQSRATANAEVAAELAVAAGRVATIARVHRRLHSFDAVQTIAFKQYVEDLSRDFSPMVYPRDGLEPVVVVEGVEIDLPAVTGIPLGFIVNELITNAAKHGNGPITVRLDSHPGKGYALTVSNDGTDLPAGFDPAVCKGLGIRIIRSLVGQIGGELHIGRGDKDQGTRFTVLFS